MAVMALLHPKGQPTWTSVSASAGVVAELKGGPGVVVELNGGPGVAAELKGGPGVAAELKAGKAYLAWLYLIPTTHMCVAADEHRQLLQNRWAATARPGHRICAHRADV